MEHNLILLNKCNVHTKWPTGYSNTYLILTKWLKLGVWGFTLDNDTNLAIGKPNCRLKRKTDPCVLVATPLFQFFLSLFFLGWLCDHIIVNLLTYFPMISILQQQTKTCKGLVPSHQTIIPCPVVYAARCQVHSRFHTYPPHTNTHSAKRLLNTFNKTNISLKMQKMLIEKV